MLHALTWFLVISLLLAWSLAAWAFHAIASWAAEQSGSLAGSTEAILALSMPEWLAPWVPQGWWNSGVSVLSELAPLLNSVLGAMPSLTGPLSILVWVVWTVGACLIVILGVLASGLLMHLGRKQPTLPPAVSTRRVNPSLR